MTRDVPSNRKRAIPTLAVIGGGASGLAAAFTAADAVRKTGKRARILVYDANEEPAKKILVTGNGRCNLSNETVRPDCYPLANPQLLRAVFRSFSNRDLLSFLHKNGFLTKTDAAGRVYPRSNQASAVREFLLYLCAGVGVEIVSSCRITSLQKANGRFILNGKESADCLILACGSCAAPRNGGLDSLFLAKALGVRVVPFVPALTSLQVSGFSKNQLKGLRAEGKITVRTGDSILMQDRGEIQYTDSGLSGIPAMQVSLAAGRALHDGLSVVAEIDSFPELTEEAVAAMLASAVCDKGNMPVQTMLDGWFPKRLSAYFMKRCGIGANDILASLPKRIQNDLCGAIKHLCFQVSAVGAFSDAQAAVGGVPAAELDYDTLALKKCRGCFVCGEMVDVVGVCGGYNLQWAWSSGFVAGKSAARELLL